MGTPSSRETSASPDDTPGCLAFRVSTRHPADVSGLGIGLALAEIDGSIRDDTVIGTRTDLYSSRASASAGIELMRNVAIVLGNAPGWSGRLRIAHRLMRDGIDLPAIQGALADLGLSAAGELPPEEAARVVTLLAKAEPSSDGLIRGQRHFMKDDTDINATRHARALVGGVAAAAIGRTDGPVRVGGSGAPGAGWRRAGGSDRTGEGLSAQRAGLGRVHGPVHRLPRRFQHPNIASEAVCLTRQDRQPPRHSGAAQRSPESRTADGPGQGGEWSASFCMT